MTPTQLKAIRQTMGLTQAQLATLLAASQPRVSAWESGERRLPACQRRMLTTLAAGEKAVPGFIRYQLENVDKCGQKP
jgi:DNA-binding transcriptional regulator YiaG